jgi:hypothetical protein
LQLDDMIMIEAVFSNRWFVGMASDVCTVFFNVELYLVCWHATVLRNF